MHLLQKVQEGKSKNKITDAHSFDSNTVNEPVFLSSLVRVSVLQDMMTGAPTHGLRGLRVFEQPLLSVGEYTSVSGVAVMHGDTGNMYHEGSHVSIYKF